MRVLLLSLTLISLLASCAKPPPPPAPPPVDDPNKIYPDRLLEEMTFPYDKYGWVETVLAFRPLAPAAPARAEAKRLEAAAAFADQRLGQARVMRRVRVHKRWVAVGLGGLNRTGLQRVARLLDDEQALGVYRVDEASPFLKKLEQWATAGGVQRRKDPAGRAFLWASSLPALDREVARLAEEVGLPEGRRLAVADQVEGTVYGYRTHLLVDPPWLTMADLKSAAPEVDTRENIEAAIQRPPVVRLAFREKAARRLAELSSRAKGRRVAFLIGGRIRAMSVIGGPVLDGSLAMPMKKELTTPQKEEEAHRQARQLGPLVGMPRLQLDGVYGSQPE